MLAALTMASISSLVMSPLHRETFLSRTGLGAYSDRTGFCFVAAVYIHGKGGGRDEGGEREGEGGREGGRGFNSSY